MTYTVRQTLIPHNVTRSANISGAHRAPELALSSMEFRSPENLAFPALNTAFKHGKGIAPPYLDDMFMPSLNN